MERKVCANASCRAITALQWRKGWPMRSGELADLCDRCGSAYDNSRYCETFHSEQSGWRECECCHKRVHCGCIVASSFVELMDFGGVRCVSCSKDSQLHLANAVECKGEEEEKTKSPQLIEFMDIDESNLLRQPPSNGPTPPSQEIISQAPKHPIVGLSNLSSNGSCMLATQSQCNPLQDKFKDAHKALGHASLNISLATPTEAAANLILPSSSGSARREGSEQTPGPSSSSFQLRPSSCPIMPGLSIPGNTGNTIVPGTSRAMIPQVRVARPPTEGRGKNQLLPRYWPRITEQELQQLSGDLNSTIVPLFEKVLSASDAGRIGRLVLPKACAETYFPPISQSEGVPVRIQDVKGNEWTFQFRFWPNNNSRMYVLEGVTPCIQSMQLRAGDTVIFSRINPGGKLMMGFRKSSESMERQKQESGTSTTHNREAPFFMGNNPTGYSDLLNSLNGLKDRNGNPPFDPVNDYGGEFSWNKNKDIFTNVHEESSQQPQISDKKKARNIGSKNRRTLMHCEDVMEVRLTWEEAQDLLRPPASAVPSVVTIDGHEFEEYDEPPVFGKKTIYINRPSGAQEQWGQCDECSKWRKLPVDVLLPPKWTCSENAWDFDRRSCSAPEEMNRKETEGVLRMVKDSRKRRAEENQNVGEPTGDISGLEALASAAVLGESIVETRSSAGPTTKHPRHRAGCSCIVCIQPPSGKGKHKSSCTCQVCMTVKRRFKTLMLRKKKRQSDAVAAAASADDAVPETLAPIGNGPIDLNCDPDREDAELEPKRSENTNLGKFPGLSGLELEPVPQANNNGDSSESSADEEGDEVEDDEEAGDEQLPVPPSDNATTPPPQEPHSDDVD